ncbi:hypothetical protein T492DRAFT_893836 [Pavlovales sp. CCMP2436]|nr:hypothetical protein T492DRAFT_893836 [Pavlovales sp. CCMP2436]
MTPSRALTFVKTINGTLKLSKRATLTELDKLFKKLFDDEEMVNELSEARSRASRLGLRGAAAQDLAQRVL